MSKRKRRDSETTSYWFVYYVFYHDLDGSGVGNSVIKINAKIFPIGETQAYIEGEIEKESQHKNPHVFISNFIKVPEACYLEFHRKKQGSSQT